MASLNRCSFIGNLGKDVDTKFTTAGLQISKFSLAVTEKVKGEDQVVWLNIVAFDKLAKVCQDYLKKGSKIYLDGKFSSREYEDSAGQKKYWVEIVANNIVMLDKKEQEASAGSYASNRKEEKQNAFEQKKEDDLPF